MPLSKQRRRLGAAGLSVALLMSACAGTSTDDVATAPAEVAEEVAAPEAAAPAAEEPAPASAGGPGLPTLVADTVTGPQIDTNDLAGQDVVVWFWAPW